MYRQFQGILLSIHLDCDEDGPKRERFCTALDELRKSCILDQRIYKQSLLAVVELLSTKTFLVLDKYIVLQIA